jgi:hypothetical protein
MDTPPPPCVFPRLRSATCSSRARGRFGRHGRRGPRERQKRCRRGFGSLGRPASTLHSTNACRTVAARRCRPRRAHRRSTRGSTWRTLRTASTGCRRRKTRRSTRSRPRRGPSPRTATGWPPRSSGTRTLRAPGSAPADSVQGRWRRRSDAARRTICTRASDRPSAPAVGNGTCPSRATVCLPPFSVGCGCFCNTYDHFSKVARTRSRKITCA